MKTERINNDLKNELQQTKLLVSEQAEKLEKFELNLRKLRKEKKILENFTKIQSNTKINHKNGHLGTDKNDEVFGGIGREDSPKATRVFSKYKLDFNIF